MSILFPYCHSRLLNSSSNHLLKFLIKKKKKATYYTFIKKQQLTTHVEIYRYNSVIINFELFLYDFITFLDKVMLSLTSSNLDNLKLLS